MYKNIIKEKDQLKVIMEILFGIKIKKINYLNSELPREQKELKSGFEDLIFKGDETYYLLENQVEKTKDIKRYSGAK